MAKTLKANIKKDVWEQRPSWNPLHNLLLDIRDYGEGLSTAASMAPSLIRGDIKMSPAEFGQHIVRGLAESYGQQKGFNPGTFAQSYIKHPLNALDILPVSEAVGISKKVAPALKATKLGKAFESMGEVERLKGPFRITEGKLPSKEIIKPLAGSSATDDFLTILRRSKKFSKGQINTWGHIYGQMMNKIPKAEQKIIMDSVKAKMGIKSTKQLKDVDLPSLIENIRAELPAAAERVKAKGITPTTKFATAPKATPFYPEPPKGQLEKALQQGKSIFSTAVLTQPGWIMGNLLGDIYHGVTGGLNPADVARYIASKKYRDIIPEKELGGFLRTTKKTDISRTGSKALDKWGDMWFGLEGNREAAFRGGAYLTKMRDMAKDSLRKQGKKLTEENLFDETARLSRMSPYYDKAIKAQKQMLGDYRTKKAFEKYLGFGAPFYKWARESSNIAARQPFLHPYKYGGMRGVSASGQDISDIQAEEMAKLGYTVPKYLQGGFATGVDESGAPKIFSAKKMLPITTPSEIAGDIATDPQSLSRMLTPLFTDPMQVLTGTNFFGSAASAPNIVTDYNGKRYAVNPNNPQDITPLENTRLPAGETYLYGASKALRDFTPLGSAERWLLPYKTYDTRFGVPKAGAKPKASDYLLHNLGLGIEGTAFKQPEIDVPRILQNYEKKFGDAGQSSILHASPITMDKNQRAEQLFMKYPSLKGKINKTQAASMYNKIYYTGKSPKELMPKEKEKKKKDYTEGYAPIKGW